MKMCITGLRTEHTVYMIRYHVQIKGIFREGWALGHVPPLISSRTFLLRRPAYICPVPKRITPLRTVRYSSIGLSKLRVGISDVVTLQCYSNGHLLSVVSNKSMSCPQDLFFFYSS